MKISHCLGNLKIEKDVEKETNFLLTNQLGDYLIWQTSEKQPVSRYQGWFVYLNNDLYKVLENIETENGPTKEFINNFFNSERVRENNKEIFLLAKNHHGFIYQSEQKVSVNLVFDFKKIYENFEQGRHYEILEKENCLLIKYCQENSYQLFLAIKSDAEKTTILKEWFLREYSLDQERNSWPWQRWIFKGTRLQGVKNIAFFLSFNEKEAEKGAEMIFKEREKIAKEKQRDIILETFFSEKIQDPEIKMAYLASQNSLAALLVKQEKKLGIMAGLPWFFQLWTRDETISLKALKNLYPKETKNILFRLLNSFNQEGRLPVCFDCHFEEKESADAGGWLFKRVKDFLKEEKEENNTFFLNQEELEEIKKKLCQVISALLKNHTNNDFEIVGPQETWMDTLKRTGAPLEIQALRLNLYQLAFELTKKKIYLKLKQKLKRKVRKYFWNKKILADKLEDFTLRPNIFLANYIFPELLSQEEWETCFKHALEKLWLEWGGISTLDKRNKDFYSFHTGESSQSYHNGDSWFWLNNLTAQVLYNLNPKKFEEYIGKILEASTNEILWSGTIGHHSELSSANNFSSQGCFSQAWSSALFIETIDKILK